MRASMDGRGPDAPCVIWRVYADVGPICLPSVPSTPRARSCHAKPHEVTSAKWRRDRADVRRDCDALPRAAYPTLSRPPAAQLARYAHAYLATVEVPGPNGGSMPLTKKPFRAITTADVEEAIERKAKPSIRIMRRGAVQWTRRVGGGPTANRLHAHLRSLWRWVIVKGYCDSTPFARAGLPTLRTRPEHARARRLTNDEAARLLAACGPHLRDVVIAALQTGCRKQELLSLQWQQVDWARNELWLPGAKTKDEATAPDSDLRRAVRGTGPASARSGRTGVRRGGLCLGHVHRGADSRHQDRVGGHVPSGRHSRPPVSRPPA
jgi:integrase